MQDPNDPKYWKMPFGPWKGAQLREIATEDLERTREWCRAREDEGADFATVITKIDGVLADRPLGWAPGDD